MAQFLEINCPQCRRGLQIRAEHVGKSIACNSCNHAFVVASSAKPPTESQKQDDTAPAQTGPTAEPDVLLQWHEFHRLRSELHLAQAELAVRTTELVALQRHARTIEEQLQRAEHSSRDHENELAQLRHERDSVRVENCALLGFKEQNSRLAREVELAMLDQEKVRLECAALRDQSVVQNDALRLELEKGRKELSTLRARLADQEIQLSQKLGNQEHIARELETLKKKELTQQQDCLWLQGQLEDLQSLLAEQEQQLVQEREVRHKAELGKLELERAAAEAVKENGFLKQRLAELENRLTREAQDRLAVQKQLVHQLELTREELAMQKQQVKREQQDLQLLADRFRSQAVALRIALEQDLRALPPAS